MASFKVHGGDFKAGNGSLMMGSLTLPQQGSFVGEHISSTELVSVEVVTQENKKKLLGTLGGGAAGLVLLGPLGAIGGMLLGGNKTNITFAGTLADGRVFVATADAALFAKLQGIASKGASARASVVSAPTPAPKPAAPPAAPVTGGSMADQVQRMFTAMGWLVTRPEKRQGSRYEIVHATTEGRSVALAISMDALGGYNLGLMTDAMRAYDPSAILVATGKSLSGDSAAAAEAMGVSIGEVSETLELIEAAMVGRPTVKKAKRGLFGR